MNAGEKLVPVKQPVAPEPFPSHLNLKEFLRQQQDVAQVSLVVNLLNVASVRNQEWLNQMEVILSEFPLLDVKEMGADARCSPPGAEEGQVLSRCDAERVVVSVAVTAAHEGIDFKRSDQRNIARNIQNRFI